MNQIINEAELYNFEFSRFFRQMQLLMRTK